VSFRRVLPQARERGSELSGSGHDETFPPVRDEVGDAGHVDRDDRHA
jgi:hypothetical protein